MIKKKRIFLIILIGFLVSIISSIYNIKNYDENEISKDGIHYHKMIKFDVYRYLSHGNEIKNQIKEGVNFFETGREHYTKYLPPRLIALYYYIFDLNLFEDEKNKIVNVGIHLNYLIFQCLFYFICVTILYFSLSNRLNNNITFFTIAFLCLEPTINQYHSTFWSESVFFSLQILLMALILGKKSSIYSFGIIGIFLAILSFQKEYSIFYIIFITIYFIFIKEKKLIRKISFMLLIFMMVQSIIGFNNYFRSGKFYIMTADSKVNIYNDMVTHVMSKTLNLSHRKFIEMEGEVVHSWIKENSIDYDKVNLSSYIKRNNRDAPSWSDYRANLNEKDKTKFDNFIRNRTIDYILDYPFEFLLRVVKNSFHITLLNPFHTYSDHNFISGEEYYFSEKHDELVKYRIFYTSAIYVICLIGLVHMIKKKDFNLLLFLVLSIIYFYCLVSWNGNTRYFVPAFIYASFFFGYGADKIVSFNKKKNEIE